MDITHTDIYTRQPVFPGHFLRAQVLLHRERVVRAAFDCRVVHDDHTCTTRDAPYACDDAGAGNSLPWIHTLCGERGEFEERRTLVENER
jgi:hypothetical protein